MDHWEQAKTKFSIELDQDWFQPGDLVNPESYDTPLTRDFIVLSEPRKKLYWRWKWPFIFKSWVYDIKLVDDDK